VKGYEAKRIIATMKAMCGAAVIPRDKIERPLFRIPIHEASESSWHSPAVPRHGAQRTADAVERHRRFCTGGMDLQSTIEMNLS
jgi:hypothetical protein